MIAFPIVVVLIVGTSLLTALVSSSLPYVSNRLNAFISRIKRAFTHKPTQYGNDLSKRIDELEEMVNNLSTNHYRRESNRKSNIRREVRDYLKQLQN